MTNNELDFIFQISSATRKNIEKIMAGLSVEQLNTIPAGFNNNIVWNYAHIIVTQQLLCYGLSGLVPRTSKDLIGKYRKGTAPGDVISKETLTEWIALGASTLTQLKEDYQAGLFKEYKTYPTSYNITLSNVDEALQFNAAHEGLHLGAVLALCKKV